MGRKCPFHPEMTMATAAAAGLSPRLTQVAIASGAKTYTVPIVDPVRVARTLVRTQNANTSRKGLTLPPSSPATDSPTSFVSPSRRAPQRCR